VNTVCLFVDTNAFLHYRGLDQIDWCALAQAESVLLLVPPVVFRELNKHKDTNSSRLLRKRAQTALAMLDRIFSVSPRASVRAGVEAEAPTNDPTIDFTTHRLRTDLQDDFLLASVLDYRIQTPGSDCRLVTADVGLGLKSRAHQVPVLSLPETLRLPDEEDPNAKRVRELEIEVNELKSRTPSLRLCFEDDSDVFKVTFSKPTLPVPDQIEHLVQQVMARHQKIRVEPPKPNLKNPQSLAMKNLQELVERQNTFTGFLGSMEQPSPEAITHYNNQLERFYSEYREYFQELPSHAERERRTVCLRIFIQNQGTAPADDVDVLIHFPDGFQMFEEEHLPQVPPPPEPPDYPKSDLQTLHERMVNMSSFSMPRLHSLSTPAPTPSNVSSPTIRRSHSYEVELHVDKLKHGFREAFDPLHLVFDAFDSAASFHADYFLHAGNIPKPVEGSLHVVVERSS
jgi:hypothetical protein